MSFARLASQTSAMLCALSPYLPFVFIAKQVQAIKHAVRNIAAFCTRNVGPQFRVQNSNPLAAMTSDHTAQSGPCKTAPIRRLREFLPITRRNSRAKMRSARTRRDSFPIAMITSRASLGTPVMLAVVLVAAHGARSADTTAASKENPPAGEIPTEWVDSATGYKLIRLSRRLEPSQSFYFHNYPFIPAAGNEGDHMLFYGRTEHGMQLFCLDLKTLDARQLTDRPPGVRGEIVAPKLREALYQCRNEIYAVNIDTRVERHIVTLPENFRGSISTINADATLLAGTRRDGTREILQRYPKKADYFDRIFEAKLPSQIFTVDVKTGRMEVVHEEVAWLNHLQFSPTDANQLMFCHEGPWHKVDRIWLIDITTRDTRLIHKRTVDREIAGHEFWAPDGKTIWFDLQVPRGETFFLAGCDLASGRETRYSLERDEWSVHYNISPDKKLFCGDGGGPNSVAHSPDGHWLYLFEPTGNKLQSTRLASLVTHDYELEPNAHFSPDGRWIIFRSNMHGSSQIYAAVVK